MDLRNSSCLISTSGHHRERDGGSQKPESLDNWIRCLFSANQKAHHKHCTVFSAYTRWVVFCIVHCMMQSAMMAYVDLQCILDCLQCYFGLEFPGLLCQSHICCRWKSMNGNSKVINCRIQLNFQHAPFYSYQKWIACLIYMYVIIPNGMTKTQNSESQRY